MNEPHLRRMIESYVGTPYREHGRDRAGVDCVGLVLAIGRDRFGSCPTVTRYRIPEHAAVVSRRAMAYARRIPLSCAGTGDLVVVGKGALATHLGVLAGSSVIHADREKGRVMGTLLSVFRRAGALHCALRIREDRWLT